MEEKRAQAFHDELSLLANKRGKSGGLGLGGGSYTWSFTTGATSERTDGLPNNPLYVHFVREGSFDAAKSSHGDGRTIKRNFDDCDELSAKVSSSSGTRSVVGEEVPKRVKLTKEQKKAAKLEAKRQAKIAQKKANKLLEKKAKREIEKKAENSKSRQIESDPKNTTITDQSLKEPLTKVTILSDGKNEKHVKKSKKKKKGRRKNCDAVGEHEDSEIIHSKESNETSRTKRKSNQDESELATVEKKLKKRKIKSKRD